MTALETLLTRVLLWATAGAAFALPVLFLPEPGDPLPTASIQLALILLFGLSLTFHLAPLADVPWFAGLEMGEVGRLALSWIVLISAVAVACGIAMGATSIAFRYDPSLQYLQLLAAVGLSATMSAIALGARRRLGPATALWAACLAGAACVFGLWRHLGDTGVGADGAWVIDGPGLMRLVIPYVLGAIVIAIALFSAGVRADGSRLPDPGEATA